MTQKTTQSGDVVTPYDKERSKKEQVTQMFDSIAPRYDFLNHLLSLGIDISWRRKAIRALKPYQPKRIVDIATGTGDFAVEALKLDPEEVIGVDISPGMLEVGKKKMKKLKVDNIISMELGDSEELRFKNNSVDAVIVGFGVRNFEDLKKGLSEMSRILKPGGAAAILEPSIPKKFPMRQLFFAYFRGVLPFLGRIVSGDSAAYTYLPESVRVFPEGEEFIKICLESGFKKAEFRPLTFGTCAFYLLEK